MLRGLFAPQPHVTLTSFFVKEERGTNMVPLLGQGCEQAERI